MKVKKYLQNFFIFILIFTFVFGNFANTGVFLNGTLQVQAAESVTKYTKNGHKTIFNADMGRVSIPEVGHKSRMTFRQFAINDKDVGEKRVICGYAMGSTHPGDTYSKRIVLATNWKDAPKNSLFMHNVQNIARGLCWFYDDVGVKNASTFQSFFIQTYVWANSMGRDVTKALKQMASSRGWSWDKKVKPLYEKVKKRKIEGYVVVYEYKSCHLGKKTNHQPYFRWISTSPDKGSISANADYELSKNVNVSVGKEDSATGEAVAGAKFKISTTGVSGSPWVLTTDKKGNASMSITRKFSGSGSGKCNYVKNWDELTTKQKKKLKDNGYYQNKSLAQAAAKKIAEKKAKEEAEKKKADFSANWTIEEIECKGYIYQKGGVNKSVTKYERGNTTSISNTFSNVPKYGKIELFKECNDSYSNEYDLTGAKYEVHKGDSYDAGSRAGEIIISKNKKDGKDVYSGTLENLNIGTYWVRETKAPDGFEKDPATYKFTLVDEGGKTLVAKDKDNQTITSLTSAETPKKGTLTLIKYLKDLSSESGTLPEKGIDFTLKASSSFVSDNPYVKGVTKTTGDDGSAVWKDIPYGYYTLTMTSEGLPDNETTVGPFTVHVTDDSDIKTDKKEYSGQNIVIGKTPESGETVDEALVLGMVAVHKTTSKTEKSGAKVFHPEAGAKFCVYDIDGNAVTNTFTTDENGYGRSQKGIKTPGTYILKQLEGTVSYKLMEDKEFEVTAEDLTPKPEPKIFEFTINNSYNGDRIFLEKEKVPFNQDKGKYEYDKKEAELDAEFSVLNVSAISSDDLAKLKTEGKIWKQAQRVQFVEKYKDALLATMRTDKNGKASADIDQIKDADGTIHSPIGKDGYVVVQTAGIDGYYLSGPLFSKDVDSKKNEDSTEWDVSLENLEKTKYAIAQFTKKKVTDGKGNSSDESDAVFKVRKNDDTYLKDPDGNDVICQADKNGMITIPWLLKGIYTLEQTDGSDLHERLNEETNTDAVFIVEAKDVIVDADDMNVFLNDGTLSAEQKDHIVKLGDEGVFTDKELPVKLTISKTSTFSGVPLKNAGFTLYKKEGDELKEIGKYYTGDGTDGSVLGQITVTGLTYGTYIIRETEAPEGYLPSEYDTGIDSTDDKFKCQEKEIVIDEDHVAKDANGDLVYRKNKNNADSSILVFRDSPIFGKIRINKSGEVLSDFVNTMTGFETKTSGIEGAVYTLYAGEDIKDDKGVLIWHKDEKIMDATTDKDGIATFINNKVDYTNDFFMGKYYIKETKAPEGFDLDTETHEVNLTWEKGPKDLDIGDWQPEDTDFTEEASHGDYFLCTGEQLNPYIINAEKVIFTYEKAPADAEYVYDVSADRVGTKDNPTTADANSTVVLWEDPENAATFYVSTQRNGQEIKFNKISSKMFYKCQYLTDAIFFNVDTSNMVYADDMFAYDTALKELDLSNWTTGRLNSTTEMFANSGLLKKIYIGDTDQKIPQQESNPIGIYVTPKQAKYLYADPDTDDPDTLEARKFTVDSFNYALCYSDGQAESIDLTEDDIASITPEYPYFKDQSNRSGPLKITITLNPDSDYYQYTNKGELEVTVDVVDPATLKLEPTVDEHPVVETDVEDAQKSVGLSVLKIDAAKKGSGEEETSGLSGAKFGVYAATDLKNYDGSIIIKKGELIKNLTSISAEEEDGGRTGADKLPAGYYAVDKNAKYLYKIVEEVPPTGYALYPDEKQNTAYIPNFDYNQTDKNTILTKLKETNSDTLSVSYDFIENTHTFAFTFTDVKAPTIRKDWGERDNKGYVEEKDRPASLTINMYTDKEKKNLYKTIKLTAEQSWMYAFDSNIDLSKYYYTEVIPNGVSWKADTREYDMGFYKNGDANCVTFYNWTDISPDFVIPSVTKYWDDNDNVFQKRPKEIKVNLLQNGVVLDDYSTVLNKSNNWTFTVKEDKALPKYDDADQEYVYTWEEDTSALPKDYELTDTKNTTSSDSKYTYVHTDITNTYAKATSAQVSKSWDDENNLYKHRPESVTVHLLANGTQINKLTLEYTENGKTKQMNITDGNVVLSKENNWSVKAVNLPKYNGKNKITYSWSEETVPDYRLTSDVTITKEEGTALEYTETTLVNHFDVPKGSVTVSKLIPVHSLDFRHGNIDFTFTLNGTTIHNKEYIDKKTVKFTKDMSTVKDKIVTVGNKEYLKLSTVFEDLDWGDYKITESGSESRYQFDKISGLSGAVSGTEKDGTPYVSFTVDYDHKEFTGTFENRTNPASVKIIKYGNNKKDKLKGVTFKIEKILADKSTELTATKETDANGEITFSDLDPGDYQITETKTVNGHSLLKDPIKVTLPVALTQKEAADKRADTTKAKYDKTNGLYYFYDVTYDVDNEAIPNVPMTGAFDNWKTFVPIILAMALFIGLGVYRMKRKKKPVK